MECSKIEAIAMTMICAGVEGLEQRSRVLAGDNLGTTGRDLLARPGRAQNGSPFFCHGRVTNGDNQGSLVLMLRSPLF